MAQPSESDFGAFLPERKSPFPETFNKRGVRGRSVLITGAGGSIGSALAEKIVGAAPRRLILLDHSEQALSELRREHRSRGHLRMAQFILADVRDDSLIESLFAEERPEIIFHAAAFKHVPLLEENPFAAVENNALATWRLAHSAAKYGVARLMLVSTDKAANPRSMLGVSKRLAELAILRWDTPASRMTALRLGNVAGSSGSVLPAFREQIRRGGPVAVTHSETTRYFLTMEETCSAIGALASVEDASGLFVPEMGKPISILNLAELMIRRAEGAQRNAAIKIQITGLRPGDKLHEDLLSSLETQGAEVARGIRAICGEALSANWIDAKFRAIEEIAMRRELGALLDALKEIVSEYQPGSSLMKQWVAAAAGGGDD